MANAPPLIFVPAGAVVRLRTWQTAQPILSNNPDPFVAAGVAARVTSRGGAFAARIKRAKWSISASPSVPGVSFGSDAVLQSLVTSSGNSAVVMPIQVGVAGEGEKACVLVFPAESADSRPPRRFYYRHVDHHPTHLAVSTFAFVAGQVNQSLIRDRLHKTVSEETQGNARRAYRLAVRHTFLNLRVGESATGANGTIVHQRTA